MAIYLSKITNYLSKLNWTYRSISDDRIFTSFQINNGQTFSLVIELDEQGEYIMFRVPHLLKINNLAHKDVFLQTMTLITYQLKMVRLEYCPINSEVLVSIEIPLEDNSLSQSQFNRCLFTLVDAIEKVILPRLTSVITTGKDSGMPPNMVKSETIDSIIKYLYQTIEQRQKNNGKE